MSEDQLLSATERNESSSSPTNQHDPHQNADTQPLENSNSSLPPMQDCNILKPMNTKKKTITEVVQQLLNEAKLNKNSSFKDQNSHKFTLRELITNKTTFSLTQLFVILFRTVCL